MMGSVGPIRDADCDPSDVIEEQVISWLTERFGCAVEKLHRIAGGNRYRSWIATMSRPASVAREIYVRYQPPRAPSAEPYDLEREAMIYRAIERVDVAAPRLLAASDDNQLIVTTALRGRADFRRLAELEEKRSIAADFITAIAALHAKPAAELPLQTIGLQPTIRECVEVEIAIWRAMYEECGREDPLIALALRWLEANVPDPDEAPVLVHGDAGPGNFLFENGHVTGLIDWELAHPGDPIEDLAWFCMRCVMEPVPDIKDNLRQYSALSGRPVDRTRLLYHRVFVSTRVVIIRHRNVTGLPGNSIVSGSLNRRLLVDALFEAQRLAPIDFAAVSEHETSRTPLYDGVIDDLKSLVGQGSPQVSDFAKNAAKVLKYLREYDRLGLGQEQRAAQLLSDLLGVQLDDPAAGLKQLATALNAGEVDHVSALRTLGVLVQHEGALAAPSSGGMAARRFPEI